MMSDIDADLVIIGAGPAGMAAACEARALNLSVLLLDEQLTLGGQIYRNSEDAPPNLLEILGKDYAKGRDLVEEFRKSGTQYLGGSTVWNICKNGKVDYIRGGSATSVKGFSVLLASGALERPFPIRGWTLPGAMTAGAAQILLKSTGAVPTEPVVLVGCGPLLYLLAWQYLRAGVRIKALVDTTETIGYLRAIPHSFAAFKGWRDLFKGLSLLATLKHYGVRVHSRVSALELLGETEVTGISFREKGELKSIDTSLVLLHQGVVPNVQLSMSTDAPHRWDNVQLCWHPVVDAWGRMADTAVYVAGDSGGIVGAKGSVIQGRLAALSVAQSLNVISDLKKRSLPLQMALRQAKHIRPFLDKLYRPKDEDRIPCHDDVVVCRCEEVTAGQIRGYVKMGCTGPNQTKAFGRCGMGPCQGRLCSLTVTEIIAEASGRTPEDVGHYRIRSPVKPILLGDFG
ncbi:opine oxidase subunit A [Roseobacter sp. GAI101]|nr:opine oxidase subunit A [Roseobacter sp. GAI101]